MSTAPPFGPEERWRRTVDQRGRPLKLKVGRLLKEFGYVSLDPGVADAIEASLGQVGLHVRPSLRDVTADQVITLELVNPSAPVRAPASGAPAPAAGRRRAARGRRCRLRRRRRQAVSSHRRALRARVRAGVCAAGARAAPDGRPTVAGGDELDQSDLVRAAVEAERRVRSAYDRSAAAAAERIAGLERELVAEREATTQARDERDELERRMHLERREAAARIQALAAAERTARGLLEAQRTELSNLTQTVRVSSAAIAQTRQTLGDVHEQVQQTAGDVRAALTDDVLLDELAQSAPPRARAVPTPTRGDDLTSGDAEAAAVEHEPAGEPSEAGGRSRRPRARAPSPSPAAATAPSRSPRAASRPRCRPGHRSPSAVPARKGRRAERLRRRASIVCAVCGRQGKTRDPAELVDGRLARRGRRPPCASPAWPTTGSSPRATACRSALTAERRRARVVSRLRAGRPSRRCPRTARARRRAPATARRPRSGRRRRRPGRGGRCATRRGG